MDRRPSIWHAIMDKIMNPLLKSNLLRQAWINSKIRKFMACDVIVQYCQRAGGR